MYVAGRYHHPQLPGVFLVLPVATAHLRARSVCLVVQGPQAPDVYWVNRIVDTADLGPDLGLTETQATWAVRLLTQEEQHV